MTQIIIGTRGSALARTQTDWVAARLVHAHPGLTVKIVPIVTQGDATQAANVPLASFGEKGIFAKELEAALLSGEIDIAVHSMKDLAATLPAGLHIAAVPEREDVRDVLIGTPLAQLPQGARVGTGSVRRVALLKAMRPDILCAEIRGNVDTRIRKLREGQYEAIILAAAGLNRLGRGDEIDEYFDPLEFTPDPGQGALAIEARETDAQVNDLLATLRHGPTTFATTAERSYLAALGGGCHTPVGAWAIVDRDRLTLHALVADPATGSLRRATVEGRCADAAELGRDAARVLGQ